MEKYQGDVLPKLNNPQTALQAYSKACELDPKSVISWRGKGDVLLAMNNSLVFPIKEYRKACKLEPENTDNWMREGIALIKMHRTDEAL